MRKRRILFVPAGAIAILLVFASIAWACTTVQGDTTVEVVRTGCVTTSETTNCDVLPGDSLVASGTGGPSHWNIASRTAFPFFLRFMATGDQDAMNTCMGQPHVSTGIGMVDAEQPYPARKDQIISGPAFVDANGDLPPTDARIPDIAGPGTYYLCFVTAPFYLWGYGEAAVTII